MEPLKLSTTQEHGEPEFKALLKTVNPEVANAIDEARKVGIPLSTILQLLIQYGPAFLNLIKQIIDSIKDPTPLPMAKPNSPQQFVKDWAVNAITQRLSVEAGKKLRNTLETLDIPWIQMILTLIPFILNAVNGLPISIKEILDALQKLFTIPPAPKPTEV